MVIWLQWNCNAMQWNNCNATQLQHNQKCHRITHISSQHCNTTPTLQHINTTHRDNSAVTHKRGERGEAGGEVKVKVEVKGKVEVKNYATSLCNKLHTTQHNITQHNATSRNNNIFNYKKQPTWSQQPCQLDSTKCADRLSASVFDVLQHCITVSLCHCMSE